MPYKTSGSGAEPQYNRDDDFRLIPSSLKFPEYCSIIY